MSSALDVVVIGAGHNGLTAAALLAKAGRSVVVVERREIVGGLARGDEFYPGFRSPGLHHDSTEVAGEVVETLELVRHGLALRAVPPDVLGLDSGLWLHGDPERTAREVGGANGESYARYRAFLDGIRALLRGFVGGRPVDLLDPGRGDLLEIARRAIRLRRLGSRTMMELLRLPPMPVGDWLGEWFESEPLKALLALPAIAGGYVGPRSPGTTANLLRHEALQGSAPFGGGPALIAALEKSCRHHGVEIRTGASVRGVLMDEGRASGVVLASGEEISATAVAASCDPKQLFLDLLPPAVTPSRLAERIRAFRARGTTAQILFALAEPPSFGAAPSRDVEHARSGGTLDDLERAFDAVKYRTFAERPILDVYVPTVSNPDLAPAGGTVLSVLVHFVPYDLAGGWTDEAREQLGECVSRILEELAPGLASRALGRDLLTPEDLERTYSLTGGHPHHGEHALDQLLIRPSPECVGYATPVRGLFLGGSGAHPGGGLTCLPGSLAASAILSARDRP